MIKTESSGIRITLTNSDLKAASKNKMFYNDDITLNDFNISKKDCFKADLIEFIQTGLNDAVLGGKRLKDRHAAHGKIGNPFAFQQLLEKEKLERKK